MRTLAILCAMLALTACPSVHGIDGGSSADNCEVTAYNGLSSRSFPVEAMFERRLQAGCKTVALDSPGGDLKTWLGLAVLIERYDVATEVRAYAGCSSGCTQALLASKRIAVSARALPITVHPTYIPRETEVGTDITGKQRVTVMQPSPRADALQAELYAQRGMPETVLRRLRSGESVKLSYDELRAMGVRITP